MTTGPWYFTRNCPGDPCFIGHNDASVYAVRVDWPKLRIGSLSSAQNSAYAADVQRNEARQIVDELNRATTHQGTPRRKNCDG